MLGFEAECMRLPGIGRIVEFAAGCVIVFDESGEDSARIEVGRIGRIPGWFALLHNPNPSRQCRLKERVDNAAISSCSIPAYIARSLRN